MDDVALFVQIKIFNREIGGDNVEGTHLGRLSGINNVIESARPCQSQVPKSKNLIKCLGKFILHLLLH